MYFLILLLQKILNAGPHIVHIWVWLKRFKKLAYNKTISKYGNFFILLATAFLEFYENTHDIKSWQTLATQNSILLYG